MTDAKRLSEVMQIYGVTSHQFYLACTLLAINGLDSALEFVRGLHDAPELPEFEEGTAEQAELTTI